MANPSQRPSPRQEPSVTLVSLIQRAIPLRGSLSVAIAIAGVMALFLGFILLLFIQELRGAAYTVLAVGGILLLAALLTSFATVVESVTGRRGRYGSNTLIMVAAFIALAVLVQVVAVRNSVRWDTTATREFSLAPQTLEILDTLAEPVQATAFFVPGASQQEPYRIPSENLLNEFQHRSNGNFDYRFIDPDLEPTLAMQYGVTQYPTIVFEGRESSFQFRLIAPLFQERDFTSALLIVTDIQRKTVYLLEGHGERGIFDESEQGFAFAADGLFRDNYGVIPISMAQFPLIPSDAAALIIAGPNRDLTDEEAQIIHAYLKGGGRLLLLLEPDPPQTFKDLLARWAVTVNEGVVVDLVSSLAGQPQTPLIRFGKPADAPPLPIDAITLPLDQSYFPGAITFQPSLPPEEMPDYIAHYALAVTTSASCLTTDLEVNNCPQGGFGCPRTPAIALQAIAPLNEEPDLDAPRETRIVVFGDTDFVTNFHFSSLSNEDLFLNAVNWLTEDISLASVRPKSIAFRRLVVTARQTQLIRGLSWFVLPAGMVLLSGVAWWRRR